MTAAIQNRANSKPRSRKVHIGVFSCLDTHFGQEIAAGAQRFARSQKRWAFCTVGHSGKLDQRRLDELDLDGLILEPGASGPAPETPSLPVVIAGKHHTTVPAAAQVIPDHRQLGAMAAHFFVSKGFHYLACLGYREHEMSSLQEDAFCRTAREADRSCRCHTIDLPGQGDAPGGALRDQLLDDWVRQLPAQSGVLTATDDLGQELLRACDRLPLAVPHQLSVVGAGNESSNLSSVDLRAERVGFEAAILIDRLTRASPGSLPELVEVPPVGVVEHGTTPQSQIDDELVREVVAYIHERAAAGLDVAELVSHFKVNRRTLERRIRRSLSTSLHQEILQTQVRRAQELLADPSLPISEVARQSGFSEARLLSIAFKRHFGITPSALRGKSEKSRLASALE